MDMPQVSSCQISQCAYNQDNQCHALAITIGDGAHPECDTYCSSSSSGGVSEVSACVGACKVASCTHNQSLECQASSIEVGFNGNEADCLTFEQM